MKIHIYNLETSFVTFCNKHGIELVLQVPEVTPYKRFVASIKHSSPIQMAYGSSQLDAIKNLACNISGTSFGVQVAGEMKQIQVGNLWVPDDILSTEAVHLYST